MLNAHMLGGHAAKATKATMPAFIWFSEVENATIAHGATGEWLREPAQRVRLNRAYTAGEAVWMAADAMIQFWQGQQLAAKDDSESLRRVLRAAIRRQV